MKYVITKANADKGIKESAISYGEFITNIIDFIIVPFVIFMMIKGINAMNKKEGPAPPPQAGPT